MHCWLNSDEVQPVTLAVEPLRFSMKICCLGRPPTDVKFPSTSSRFPLWLSCWL